MRTRRNILISGATGSGKTTLSKALIAAIPAHERLITIEDTAELVVPHQNCVRLLYAKDGQGVAKVGPATAGNVLAHAARPHPAAGAARRHRLLLSAERELGASRDRSRRSMPTAPGSPSSRLTLLVKESAEGRDLHRDDIRSLLLHLVDVVVQMQKRDGRYRISEIYYDPVRKRDHAR